MIRREAFGDAFTLSVSAWKKYFCRVEGCLRCRVCIFNKFCKELHFLGVFVSFRVAKLRRTRNHSNSKSSKMRFIGDVCVRTTKLRDPYRFQCFIVLTQRVGKSGFYCTTLTDPNEWVSRRRVESMRFFELLQEINMYSLWPLIPISKVHFKSEASVTPLCTGGSHLAPLKSSPICIKS